MKKAFAMTVLSICGLLASSNSFAREGYCTITEPKGGPLNVRAVPDGKILTKLPNGRRVIPGEIDYDSYGQPWVQVSDAKSGRYLGWVFREYIACY